MFDLIEKIRNKPEVQKKRIALGIALLITALIFIIWLVTFMYSVDTEGKPVSSDENSPLKDLKETFSHFIDQVGGSSSSSTPFEQ